VTEAHNPIVVAQENPHALYKPGKIDFLGKVLFYQKASTRKN
jgi:hypothetical protein